MLLQVAQYLILSGTKIGCRAGDCGACTVLIGELQEGKIRYQSMTSCLTPLANVQGKHVLTVEGIEVESLSPVQKIDRTKWYPVWLLYLGICLSIDR